MMFKRRADEAGHTATVALAAVLSRFVIVAVTARFRICVVAGCSHMLRVRVGVELMFRNSGGVNLDPTPDMRGRLGRQYAYEQENCREKQLKHPGQASKAKRHADSITAPSSFGN
jgi:hypothetical protein